MADEPSKHPHPLSTESTELFNIVNGKVADESINVAATLAIGQAMAQSFKESLTEGFPQSFQEENENTWIPWQKGVKIGSNIAFNI